MKLSRILMACSLALAMPALASCAALGNLGTVAEAPAPLAQTQIDENVVKVAYESFDLALDAVNGLRAAGVIKDQTPAALKIADAIDVITAALAAADDARQASNTESWSRAMDKIRDAFIEMRIAIAKAT